MWLNWKSDCPTYTSLGFDFQHSINEVLERLGRPKEQEFKVILRFSARNLVQGQLGLKTPLKKKKGMAEILLKKIIYG